MRLGILQTGHAPDELLENFGDYDLLFRRLLGESTFDYVTYPVVDDIFPDSVESADGWLITGSRYSVNDPDPWIGKLIALIRQIKASGRPMVGICFGHQAIAKALGGAVGENPAGWIAGASEYRTPEGAPDRTLLAWHKEQILTLPGEAEIVSGSSACPHAVLRYGDVALTYQAHPEFTADFIRGLVVTRGQSLTDGIKNRASNADDAEIARARTSAEIATFLKFR
ncbi:type 1 glutamine amidotransferase [Rhizobium phaseoli]|uniref:Type 1 glutamine amidotransferase n=1 Tax=Rhizobium phaseoli TaxID=396 RepID=A0A7K3U885_9HYPH|nr:type 1 glutamine amidotransferase [Rhizobium phaseoli]NEJ69555.1 type 1 glutamine amidotransferase [Rhizobium phaseoli]